MPAPSELYTRPASFEPLLPAARHEELIALTHDIHRFAGRLEAALPSPLVRQRIAALVCEMNSYYSNLIEGHKTLPADIECAMSGEFAAQPAKRANQHLARAHILAERSMMRRIESEPAMDLFGPDFIGWLHREFYQHLPAELQTGEKADGSAYPIPVGQFRDHEVTVGAHQPPHFGSLPAFMARFSAFYGGSVSAADHLIALAAGHHRLAWIHPFSDGNGRVCRLHTHAWLHRQKVGALGLWTISRGLARQRADYYAALSAADLPRQGDLDGRGNLSDCGLANFCVFFLKTALDQIEFMSGLLDLHSLARRIEAHLHVQHASWSANQRDQVARVLKAALIEGTLERGAVPQLIGRGITTASSIIRLALQSGLVDTTHPINGPLSLVFDSRVLDSYFPRLFQEVPIATA
jgi:Fic family protein